MPCSTFPSWICLFLSHRLCLWSSSQKHLMYLVNVLLLLYGLFSCSGEGLSYCAFPPFLALYHRHTESYFYFSVLMLWPTFLMNVLLSLMHVYGSPWLPQLPWTVGRWHHQEGRPGIPEEQSWGDSPRLFKPRDLNSDCAVKLLEEFFQCVPNTP